jgi:N6-L-threonylcarbamoyladenine synthase
MLQIKGVRTGFTGQYNRLRHWCSQIDCHMNNASSLTVLGIETSCDETAAAVVRRTPDSRGSILSNCLFSQLAEHAPYGGVVPEIAARSHISRLDGLIARALAEARCRVADLDGIAATAGPGLLAGVLVGVSTAKAIALAGELPFIAINHLEGHALTPGLTGGLRPPYLLLLISGGHTQLLAVADVGRYIRYGTTMDDALGEAFDKIAKLLGLAYPGGPAVENLARDGDAGRFDFPRPLRGRDDCHFSFSGLKTAVRLAAEAAAPLDVAGIRDICAGFQAAVIDVLADRCAVAMDRFSREFSGTGSRVLVAAGGVAANAAVKAGLQRLCSARGFLLDIPPPALCTDNAAMIAWAGAQRLARGLTDDLNAPARARWPLDPAAAPAPGAGVKA